MADISIQFWATADELANWLREWLAAKDITLIAMTFQPFSVKSVLPRAVAEVVQDATIPRLYMFLSKEVKLDVTGKPQFESANQDGLIRYWPFAARRARRILACLQV